MIKEMNENAHVIFISDEDENEIEALEEGIIWFKLKSFEIKSTPRLNENPEDEKVLDLPDLVVSDIKIVKSGANTTSKKSPAKKIDTISDSE